MIANPVALRALAIARQQIGKPYLWGASGPNSFDCSGLLWYAYQRAGHSWVRTNDVGQALAGQRVTRVNLLPGDLVRPHIGHIQMYAGNGRIVEAPKRGINVREVPMWGFLDGTRVMPAINPTPIYVTLRYGDQGTAVRTLQTRLGVLSDGDFGPLTRTAVINYQSKHGLVPDGIVGTLTRASLW